MNLTEIQHAIEALPTEQQASLAVWLSERDRHRWDVEIEQDFSPGGTGMALLDRVRAQVDRRESKPLAEAKYSLFEQDPFHPSLELKQIVPRDRISE